MQGEEIPADKKGGLVAGLITLIARFKTSVSVRIVLTFILVYPVGDCLAWAPYRSKWGTIRI